MAIRSIASLDSDLAAAIVAASVAGFVSVLTVVYGQRRVKEREIAEAHRPQKVKVYRGYMELMFDVLRSVKDRNEVSESQMSSDHVDKMYSFRRELILWGSPGVIRAYLQWEEIASSDAPPRERLLGWDKMLREFRKDLGNSNWLLKEGQLMYMILTSDAREEMEAER